MNPSAPEFVPTSTEVLLEYIESVGKAESLQQWPNSKMEGHNAVAAEPEGVEPVINRPGNFVQHHQSDFKRVDICSLEPPKRRFWGRLPDDETWNEQYSCFGREIL